MKREVSLDPAVRDVAVLTLISVAAAMLGSATALALSVGFDFAAPLSVGRFWAIGMTLSFAAPLLICPVVALPGRRLIRDLRRARAELERAARQDSLTGLLNRRGFAGLAAARLEACQFAGVSAVAVMCDIDLFKSINDRFGHDFGDTALERVASMIETSVGEHEALIGRLGGEEFAIFFPDCGLADGEKLAGAIRAACENLSIGFGMLTQPLTLSLGVAAVESDDEGLRSLLSRADAALYQAKRDGRNRVVVAPNRKSFSLAA